MAWDAVGYQGRGRVSIEGTTEAGLRLGFISRWDTLVCYTISAFTPPHRCPEYGHETAKALGRPETQEEKQVRRHLQTLYPTCRRSGGDPGSSGGISVARARGAGGGRATHAHGPSAHARPCAGRDAAHDLSHSPAHGGSHRGAGPDQLQQ